MTYRPNGEPATGKIWSTQPSSVSVGGRNDLNFFVDDVARFSFARDHEIIRLTTGLADRAYSGVTPNVPSIGTGLQNYGMGELADNLFGGCWVSLLPTSDLPYVIITDREFCRNLENGEDPKIPPQNWLITHTPCWIPPLKNPVIFPPLMRYIGNSDDIAGWNCYPRTNIGGLAPVNADGENWTVPSATSGVFQFRIFLRSTPVHHVAQLTAADHWRFTLLGDISATTASQTPLPILILLPTFIGPGSPYVTHNWRSSAYATALQANTGIEINTFNQGSHLDSYDLMYFTSGEGKRQIGVGECFNPIWFTTVVSGQTHLLPIGTSHTIFAELSSLLSEDLPPDRIIDGKTTTTEADIVTGGNTPVQLTATSRICKRGVWMRVDPKFATNAMGGVFNTTAANSIITAAGGVVAGRFFFRDDGEIFVPCKDAADLYVAADTNSTVIVWMSE